MDPVLLAVVALIAIALVFDFINGFHDAANSIATIVATRVLTPGQAVMWAAAFNFLAAFGFGTAVAKTVGSGMIDLDVVTASVIFGGLTGAIVWDLITWYYGLPTSSSHALVGGYAGAAIAKAGFGSLVASGWTKTLIFIVFAPLMGMALGWLLSIISLWLFRGFSPSRVDRWFRRLQLVSAALYSLGHGTNDAQKTMGIIAGVLFTAGYLSAFEIPFWVIIAAHLAIALGTPFISGKDSLNNEFSYTDESGARRTIAIPPSSPMFASIHVAPTVTSGSQARVRACVRPARAPRTAFSSSMIRSRSLRFGRIAPRAAC